MAVWSWATVRQATLLLNIPPCDNCYFMAEVSALDSGQASPPHIITLSINDTTIGEWKIDSTTIHDKLVIIPIALLQHGQPTTITFTLQTPAMLPPTAGMQLHTITLDTNLKPYLDELQTGYNWVCAIRNELLDTIRRVLFFLDSIDDSPVQITTPLRKILQDPYVLARNEARLIFDEDYFQSNFCQLKEGNIHQAIRQWAADLQHFMALVVNAGNYATRQPEISCWNPDGLLGLIKSPLEFTEKIAQLRAKNITLNNLEILLHKEKIDSVPPILYLDITNRCNFRCRMCYQSSSHFLRQNLINTHLAVIMEMVPYLTGIVVAGLGEPLLSKNLLPFVERTKALQCHTTIITNGSLITGNIDVLKQFSGISISFDGAQTNTFETLRNRSNFKQIINNIKKLRHEAPHINISFSVVVSRANLDELAGIVQWAADLGVNAINMTPLDHMPVFELKKSDFPLFQAQLEEAKRIAQHTDITLTIGVGPDNFSYANDTPRDKNALLAELSAMKSTQGVNQSPATIGQDLQAATFNYYPAPIVFMRPTWPEITTVQPDRENPAPDHPEFDINRELFHLDDKISNCLHEISERPRQPFTIPYCLDPWKLNYVKSNGTSRLCCHSDIAVGDLGGQGFKQAINSPQYQKIRQSMIGRQTLLPKCRECHAADRTMEIESVYETCRAYGISVAGKIKNP